MTVRAFLLQHSLIAPHQLPSATGEFQIECPQCHHAKHKFFVSAMGNGVKCFHCGFGESWRRFQRRYEPPTPEEVALETYVANCEAALQREPVLLAWLADRGFDAASIKRFRFGYSQRNVLPQPQLIDSQTKLSANGQWFLEDRITIPYIHDGIVLDVRGRVNPNGINATNQDKKYLSLPGTTTRVYLPATVDPAKPVVLTEGEFDAALLCLAGIQGVGVPGATNFDRKLVSGWTDLFIAFDGDDAGRQGATSIIKKLPEVRKIDLPDGFDVSEYIQNFGIDSFNTLMARATLYLNNRPQKEDRWNVVVDDFSDWAWSNGQLLGPKITWAPGLERALSGWAPGLILLGAIPNLGKSCFIAKSAYQAAIENKDDTLVIYLSLDDTMQEAMTRIASIHLALPFEEVRTPRLSWDHPTDAARRDQAMVDYYNKRMDELKALDNLIVRDATHGRSLDYLRTYIKGLRAKHPEKKIVCFVDSLAKLTIGNNDKEEAGYTDESSVRNAKAYVATELKYITTENHVCLVTPTDLRKLNHEGRPTNFDLKDASELHYEANAILLGFTDFYGDELKRNMVWTDQVTQQPQPIIEWNISKNKFTAFRGALTYQFNRDTADYKEC